MREKVTLMPLSQIRLLLKIWDSPDRRAVVSGKSGGAVIKVLYKKGYVRPTGKVGRTIRWAINEEWFSDSDIALMRELVSKSVDKVKIPDHKRGVWIEKNLDDVAKDSE